MSMLTISSTCRAEGGAAGRVGFRENQLVLDGAATEWLTCLSVVLRRRGPSLGRAVNDGLYSMINSLSSFVGDDGGMPSLIGADSPLKRSPKIL